MKFTLALTSLALCLTVPISASAQSDLDRDAAREVITEILAPWAQDADGPGALIQVSVEGEPILVQAAGLAHLEHNSPISAETRFQVASVSKQFTAYAILMLVEEGRLGLDDQIADHIPEADQYEGVTLRDLLAHTHGIRDPLSLVGASGLREQDVVTQSHALRLMLRQQAMNFEPGDRFAYSNGGFVLLAEVVARVTGQSLGDYCRENIFTPIGMDQTGFFDRLDKSFPDRAESYFWTGDRYGHAAFNYALVGSTGLVSTAGDLALWTYHLDQLAESNPSFYQSFHTLGRLNDGRVTTYAYGQERRFFRGLETWSHGGRDAGYRAFLLRVPSHQMSISVLSNAAEFNVADATYTILEALLEGRLEPVIEDTSMPTPEQLASYEGDYALFPGLVFSLRATGETLELSIPGQVEAMRLPPVSDHSFELNSSSNITLDFDPAVEGRAQGFDYQLGMMGKLRADRIELQAFNQEGLDLSAFAGSYYSHELSAAYDVKVDDGRLVLSHPALGDIALLAFQPDTFISNSNYHQQIAFTRGSNGDVQGFDLSGVLMNAIEFVRVQ